VVARAARPRWRYWTDRAAANVFGVSNYQFPDSTLCVTDPRHWERAISVAVAGAAVKL
jgi:hypothetical protein